MIIDDSCFGIHKLDDQRSLIYLDKYNPIELKNEILKLGKIKQKISDELDNIEQLLSMHQQPCSCGSCKILNNQKKIYIELVFPQIGIPS